MEQEKVSPHYVPSIISDDISDYAVPHGPECNPVQCYVVSVLFNQVNMRGELRAWCPWGLILPIHASHSLWILFQLVTSIFLWGTTIMSVKPIICSL